MKNITHSLKIVLVLMMCFAGHAAWAQVSSAKTKFKKSPVGVPFVERAKADAPQTRGVATEQMLNYAYCGNVKELSAIGYGEPIDHNLAIYVPGDMAANATISALEFNMAATNFKNVKIWASTTLPESPDAADLVVQTVSKLNVKAGQNLQNFKQPIAIPEGGLYVGVSFDITALKEDFDSYPIVFAPLPLGYSECCFAQLGRETDPYWMDLGYDGYGLFLGALISGEFNENSLAVPATFPQTYVLSGTEEKVALPVIKYGTGENITSLSYTIKSASGSVTEEKEVALTASLPYLMSMAYVEFPMPAGAEAKSEERTVTITKVNGVANTCAANASTGLVTTFVKSAESVPVMEEFTGGWCGFCPRGAVALEMLNEQYGDGVVTIAVHGGDAMEIPEYAFLTYSVSGFPSATVNRGEFIDPYYDMYVVDEAKQAGSPAKVVLESEWADEAKTSIRMKATTTFHFNQDESSFALGYVLLHDGLKGTGSAWVQQNYYAGAAPEDSNLAFLSGLPAAITDYEYNHVAIAAWGADYGVEGSVPGSVVADEAKVHTYTCKIDDLELLQDKEKLTVAVLLLDNNTGAILNAAKSKIGKYDPTAIKEVEDGTATLKSIYTLSGQKVTKTMPGRIYLYKYADGKVLKSMAK